MQIDRHLFFHIVLCSSSCICHLLNEIMGYSFLFILHVFLQIQWSKLHPCYSITVGNSRERMKLHLMRHVIVFKSVEEFSSWVESLSNIPHVIVYRAYYYIWTSYTVHSGLFLGKLDCLTRIWVGERLVLFRIQSIVAQMNCVPPSTYFKAKVPPKRIIINWSILSSIT